MNKALRIRLITTLSATLEFYDFTLLIFLAPVIARVFFPGSEGLNAVMPVLLLFFAGYLARFVGGLVYSHCGDLRGRKGSYVYSIVLMSLATLGIGLLPGYTEWGLAAPLSLLALRILQGFSLGGEIPGAVVFAAEHTETRRRGMVTGLVISGVTFGNVLASGVVGALYFCLGDQVVFEWGWRLAFIGGSCLGLLSLWLRLSLDETPVYLSMETVRDRNWPVQELLRSHPMELIRGTLVAALPAVSLSVLFFMPRYQQEFLGVSPEISFSMSTSAFMVLTGVTIIMAILSDRVGRLPMIRSGGFLLMFLPAGFCMMTCQGMSPMLALLPLLVGCGMVMGVYESSMSELFPTRARYSGVAFCHNLAFAFCGGITPVILEWLCVRGWLMSPALLPTAIAVLLTLSSLGWVDRYRQDLACIES